MKRCSTFSAWTFLLALVLTLARPAIAQTTVFTYQGRLNAGGAPANGIYDLQFTVFDAASNGNVVAASVTTSAVGVSNGLFTVALDFGSGVFTGGARWLDIAVRTNGGGAFTSLTPRQALTATPYALYAPAAGTANVAGTATNLVAGATIVGNGAGLTNLNGATLQAGTVNSNALDAATRAVLGTGGGGIAANVTYSYWVTNTAQLIITGSSSNMMNGIWSSNTVYASGVVRWPAYTNPACPGCVLWNDNAGVTGFGGWVATNANGIVEVCLPPDYSNPVGPFDYTNSGWGYSDLSAFEPAMNSWYASNYASSLVFSGVAQGTVAILPTLTGTFAGDMSGTNILTHTVPPNALVDYSLTATNLSDALFLPILAGNLDAATNINRFGWTHFTGKLYSNAPVRILIVGNGFAFSPFNMLDFFVPRLEAAGGLPDNGRLIRSCGPGTNVQRNYGYDSVWYNGDAVVLTNDSSTVDIYTDPPGNVRGVYYVVTNIGGAFKLQSFTGGAWQDISGPLSSYNATSSYVTNCLIMNQAGVTSDTLRVQGLSGTNIILCGTCFNTLTNGVIWGKYAIYSSSLLNVMAPPTSYLAPLFTNWAPDLILVKEDFPGTALLPYFEAFSQFVTTNCPNADVVWCGLHPAGLLPPGNANYPGSLQMEVAIRQLCVKYRMSYFDAWSALGGRQVWAARNWDLGDGVHPNGAGTAAYDALLWAWLSPFSRAR